MYRFARSRVPDRFSAEDLVQEALLAAYRAKNSFSGRSSLKTWLIGILRHKIVDHYRKMPPELGDEDMDAFTGGLNDLFDPREKWRVKPGDWRQAPESIFESNELMAAIHACLEDMPEKSSRVYAMRELEGLDTGEICELLKMEKNNCWVILYRARMFLRRCLEINWFSKER